MKTCMNCSVVLTSAWGTKSVSKYCSVTCQQAKQHSDYIERWKSGSESGKKGSTGVSSHIRRYIHEKYEGKCCKCGWNQKNPVTGKAPLDISHKNGDWRDNSEENLELICPNCHALEPTFKALNKGKGRYTVAGVVNPGNNKRK
jgi:hypothetical protein